MPLLTPRRLLAFTLLAAAAGAAVLLWRWQPGPWARAHHEQAAALARAGQFAQARAELRQVLQRLPWDRDARWAVIQLELRQQRREQGYLELLAYTELFPDRPEGWSLLATLLQAGGLPEEALAAADRAVAAAPGDPGLRAQRARIRAQLGRRAAAQRDVAAALAVAPQDPSLIELQRRVRELPAPDVPPDPSRIRVSAAAAHGALAETHAMVWPGPLASLRQDTDRALQRGDAAAARAVAERAEADFPGSVIAPWLLGVTALSTQDPAEAERQFRIALARAPRSTLVAKALAQVWQQRDGAAAAAQALESLVAADPGFAFARRHAAASWLAARQPDRAEAFLRATAAAATDPEPVLELARFLIELDRPEEARQACAEGAARFPQDPELPLLQARILARAGDTSAAIGLLHPRLREHPDRVDDRVRLASLVASRGSPADRIQAKQMLEALEAETLLALESVDAMGWAWTLSGAAGRGLPWLEAAVGAAPQRPDLRYHLAAAQLRLGRRQEAKRELDAALASGQPFAEQPEALKLRRRL